MGIATSIVIITIGAILRFAVPHQDIVGVNLGTIGVILIIVGVIWLIISVSLLARRRRTDVIEHRGPAGYRPTYVDPGRPKDPYV